MHNSIADWMADRGHEARGMADLRAFLEYHASKRKKSFNCLSISTSLFLESWLKTKFFARLSSLLTLSRPSSALSPPYIGHLPNTPAPYLQRVSPLTLYHSMKKGSLWKSVSSQTSSGCFGGTPGSKLLKQRNRAAAGLNFSPGFNTWEANFCLMIPALLLPVVSKTSCPLPGALPKPVQTARV